MKESITRRWNDRCTSCHMVDAYMAVSHALGEEDDGTDTNSENGGVLCYVVDRIDENKKIQNANVLLTNIESGDEYTTTTDELGHFEIMVPEGKYSLKVTATGYEDYIWPDENNYQNPIIVKNEGIKYLDDWIKMKMIAKESVQLSVFALESKTLNPITNKEILLKIDNSDVICSNSKQMINSKDGSVIFDIHMGEKNRLIDSKVTLHIDGYKDFVLDSYRFGNDPADILEFDAIFEKESETNTTKTNDEGISNSGDVSTDPLMFGRTVKKNESVIFTSREYNKLLYEIMDYNTKSEDLNTLVSFETSYYQDDQNIVLVGDKLYYCDVNGLNAYDFETMKTELKWQEDSISIVDADEAKGNLIIRKDGSYYTFNVKNGKHSEYFNKGNILAADDSFIYYYIIDEDEINGWERTNQTHIYKYELAAGTETKLADIPIAAYSGDGYSHYAESCIADNKLVFSYGSYNSGTAGGAIYTIAVYDLNNAELKTISKENNVIVSNTSNSFAVINNNVYYFEEGNIKQYNLKSGGYKDLDIKFVIDDASDKSILYQSENDYYKYDAESDKNVPLLKQSDILVSSDPDDAFLSYNCLGISDNYAVINVNVLSYKTEYNPAGWRGGHVRSVLKVIRID